MTISPKTKSLLRWVGGLALLAYILSQLSLPSLLELLTTLAVIPLILSLLAKLAIRVLVAAKWYFLVRVRDESFKFKDALAMHFIGGAAGIALPLLGVDAVVGYTYYKQRGGAGTAISTILADRVISTYALIFVCVVAVLIDLERVSAMPGLVNFVGLLVLGAVLGPVVLLWISGHRVLRERLRFPEKIVSLTSDVVGGLRELAGRGLGMLLLNVVFALATQLMRVVAVYTVALAVHEEPSFVDFTIITPLTFLIAMLPLTVGGLGVEQGAYIVLFGLVGISAESAFVMSVVGAALTTVSVLPGVALILQGWGTPARDLKSKQGAVP